MDQRVSQHREIRRAVYIEFLGASMDLHEKCRAPLKARVGSAREELQSAHAAAFILRRRVSVVALEGPPSVVAVATRYAEASLNYYDSILAVAAQAAEANTEDTIGQRADARCNQAATHLADANAQFVGSAREVLGGAV
ncbi:hypothetical protein [Streptomyces sp. NPDC057557]|uniref:hypothetical protein n=1 Tax=Streptomyces sp. NPDC057557 TaxID=3346167 RepID=UPI0036C79991